jgi:Mn2+/Fe2+ NRAMP family transporter
VISAAFIGPGTITTAVSAGSSYQLDLLWAVTLATVGCILLQEVSARIVIASNLNLGQATARRFGEQKGKWFNGVIGVSVIAGCAAYEAGNILGAVAGVNLLTGMNTNLLTVLITLISFVILWTDKRQVISWLMTFLVGLMGIAFFVLAFKQNFSPADLFVKAVVPVFPGGAELLILGLVGTTIVPYSIFLGSGITKGQTIPLMRIGLTISVIIGGLITAAILVAGTSVGSFASFPELAVALEQKLGRVGSLALGIGLFAAGFSSAITAPYASSIIASTIFGWQEKWKHRVVWGIVLLTGFFFGISGIKPIPVILTVQALNGLILPLLVALLIFLVNDSNIIPSGFKHGWFHNFVLLLILGSVLLIGFNQIDKALIAFGFYSGHHLVHLTVLSSGIVVLLGLQIFKMNKA